MNIATRKILSFARKCYTSVHPSKEYEGVSFDNAQFTGQEASDLIRGRITDENPLLVARLGTGELNYLYNSLIVNRWKWGKYFKYITGETDYLNWQPWIIDAIVNNAGFFSHSDKQADRFASLMLNDFAEIDILGVFSRQEDLFKKQLAHTIKIRLFDIEPFIHTNPWSEALQGKKVLVIHPFEESIVKQYKHREKLFKDPRVLPGFELKTIKAVQSIAGVNTCFNDWFEALDFMKARISEIDFDISIIGCGAYGMPLAAHIKRLGKKAIHLGGATQLLFGIKGARWENHPDYVNIINEYWVKPSPDETPEKYKNIEGGCYW